MSVYANYDDVQRQLRAFGLEDPPHGPAVISTLVVDPPSGRAVVRCRDKDDRGKQMSGWYRLHELRRSNGETFLVGAYGSWREGGVSHKVELGSGQLSPAESTAIRARIAEDRRRAEYARKAIAAKAAARAERAWINHCKPEGDSEYLKRKAIGAHGARFTPSGNLVVPIMDAAEKIHGLQVIYSDPKVIARKGRDKDFWPVGLSKRGHFFRIGGTPMSVLLVAEGFATGCSLHQATGLPVLVAFDCGNLLPAAQAAHKRWPNAKILFCADDDFKTDGNPGITAASAATLALADCAAWVAPAFKDRGDRKLTDFNDLHLSEGLHVVRAQVEFFITQRGWDISLAPLTPLADGGRGDQNEFDFSPESLLRNFVLIYGTETVFDQIHRSVISLSALRAAAGKSNVRSWLENDSRLIAMPEQIVFEPAGTPAGCYNLWGGWPTQAKSGACEAIVGLLEYLCSGEENSQEVFDWVLCWLAYPIQHPGAKMQTALLVHGPEGTGKNMFFGIVRQIYGRYGGIFSQTELESQFNGYASRKLFMIGNEVVTRTEIYHQQGRLKNMITEPEWQVNEKNMPTRLEANHCNFAFFSNRLDIARLDPKDRRYCVIWTPEAAKPEIYEAVKKEVDAGGVAALHDYLLNLNLGGFAPHTAPPMTRSKADLVDLSLDSTERFWLEWTAGHLPVPCTLCKSSDLYRAYRYWSQITGVFKPAPEYVLLGTIGKKNGVKKERLRHHNGTGGIEQSRCVRPPGVKNRDVGTTETAWASEMIESFATKLKEWLPK